MNILNIIRSQKYSVFIFILGIISGIFYLIKTNSVFFFVDLNLYQIAINEFNSGNTPYRNFGDLSFVYSPFVLFFMSLFKENLTYILVIFYFASFITFLSLKETRIIFFYSVVSSIIFFNHLFIRSIFTGNITIFLHFTIISSFVFSQNKRKNLYFFIAVFISSIIKPYLLAYLLLLFLNEKKYLETSKNIFIFIGLYCLVFLSQYVFYPDYFFEFINSLYSQAIGAIKIEDQDIGLAPFSIFSYYADKKISLLMHFLFLFLIFLILFKKIIFSLNLLDDKSKKYILFLLLIIMITFLNPRMKLYDFWLEVAASTAIIFILFSQIKIKKYLIILISFTIIFSVIIALLNSDLIKYLKVYVPPIFSIILLISIHKPYQLLKNLKN